MSTQETTGTSLQDQAAPAHGVLLTPVAAAKVRSLLEQEGRDDLRLRVAVQPGGCSGLRYQLYFDERTLDGDLSATSSGVEVVIDRMSAPYLDGATHRLRRHDREAGLHDRQPQRHGLLRLRRLASTEAAPSSDPVACARCASRSPGP